MDTATRAWTSPTLNGQLYGEPLVFGDRVYVATENDVVYALSAATGAIVWTAQVGRAVPSGLLPCSDINPTVGITGTPVIDPARQEIYVVADELKNGTAAHMLTGLNTSSGQVELSEDVDPPGQIPLNLLQRTGLTLDDGHVYWGFGGNAEDCGKYRGRVAGVPVAGGAPRFFTADAAPDENNGAVWMGGGAPAVGPNGDLWVTTGNGSLNKHPYDHSDAVLELSPSLRLLQFFAPASWRQDNANDLDFSTEPVLLSDGQVIGAGKSSIVYLLNGSHLGSIGGQQAKIGPVSVCTTNIDGGTAHAGMTVYLPCLGGIVAVKATRSPPALRALWIAGVGGGPPIVAGGLVWTIGQNGKLYGLGPATGKTRQEATIGVPANHFPTPGIGAGLLLAPSARNVVAFRTSAAGSGTATSAARVSRHNASPRPATGGRIATEVVLACLVAAGALGWFVWFIRRQRRT